MSKKNNWNDVVEITTTSEEIESRDVEIAELNSQLLAKDAIIEECGKALRTIAKDSPNGESITIHDDYKDCDCCVNKDRIAKEALDLIAQMKEGK